jgi:hypothetical protein
MRIRILLGNYSSSLLEREVRRDFAFLLNPDSAQSSVQQNAHRHK